MGREPSTKIARDQEGRNYVVKAVLIGPKPLGAKEATPKMKVERITDLPDS